MREFCTVTDFWGKLYAGGEDCSNGLFTVRRLDRQRHVATVRGYRSVTNWFQKAARHWTRISNLQSIPSASFVLACKWRRADGIVRNRAHAQLKGQSTIACGRFAFESSRIDLNLQGGWEVVRRVQRGEYRHCYTLSLRLTVSRRGECWACSGGGY